MSGLTQDNPQSNADRQLYMSMVRNAIRQQNAMKTGDIDNTITIFGSLAAMREVMGEQHELMGLLSGHGISYNPYDKSGGQREIHIDIDSHKNEPNDDEPKGGEIPMSDSDDDCKCKGGEKCGGESKCGGGDSFDRKVGGFLPLVFAPAYYGIKKLFGGEKADEYKEKTGGMNLLEVAMPGYAVFKKLFGGDMKKLTAFKRHYNKALKSGGMVLSPEAAAYHKKRSGGKAPTGADFSGADIVNSEPLKNSGPDVGTKAALGDKVPNTNAGQGVQTWTEYPNKNLSNQDIKEATATTRDVQNGFPVANAPSSGGRKRGRPSKRGGFFGPLKSIMQLGDTVENVGNIPIVDKAVKGFTGLFGLGKQKRGKRGGAMAVASPDIDEGKRSPIVSGINTATQIDGFQDPRTTGMASQAGVGAPLGGKKRRNRKPMTAEQKKAFAMRMAAAKLKVRQQK